MSRGQIKVRSHFFSHEGRVWDCVRKRGKCLGCSPPLGSREASGVGGGELAAIPTMGFPRGQDKFHLCFLLSSLSPLVYPYSPLRIEKETRSLRPSLSFTPPLKEWVEIMEHRQGWSAPAGPCPCCLHHFFPALLGSGGWAQNSHKEAMLGAPGSAACPASYSWEV